MESNRAVGYKTRAGVNVKDETLGITNHWYHSKNKYLSAGYFASANFKITSLKKFFISMEQGDLIYQG